MKPSNHMKNTLIIIPIICAENRISPWITNNVHIV